MKMHREFDKENAEDRKLKEAEEYLLNYVTDLWSIYDNSTFSPRQVVHLLKNYADDVIKEKLPSEEEVSEQIALTEMVLNELDPQKQEDTEVILSRLIDW